VTCCEAQEAGREVAGANRTDGQKESKMKMFNGWMCLLVTTICLVASAHGQQSAGGGQAGTQGTQGTQNADLQQGLQSQGLQNEQIGIGSEPQGTQPGQIDQQPGQLDQADQYRQGTLDDGTAAQDRSMPQPEGAQPGDRSRLDRPGMTGDGRPGELGVYLIEGAGPGVVIARIVRDSAAGEAGLQSGDVVLQINGQSVEAPPEVTRIIRATPAGETVTLRVWRNGQEQDITATLRPAGERYSMNYRGDRPAGMSGDLESRTRQLESQLAMVMQELQRLRQEVSQLRAGTAGTSTGIGTEPARQPIPPDPTQPGLDATNQNATQPGFDVPPAGQERPSDTDTGLPF
jgi:hypothetical protein